VCNSSGLCDCPRTRPLDCGDHCQPEGTQCV
jgi:hypothetical protein